MQRLILAATAALIFSLTLGTAHAQSLTVLPVSIQMAPGEMATTLTVINQSDHETAVQIRAFAWDQNDGTDQLVPSKGLLESPPLGTIPAGASQVVRLVQRQTPQGKEATYRIFLDQIPAPAEPGTVRIALRLSIPLFSEPTTRVAPHLQWRVENKGDLAYLVAYNDGGRHETVRDITLATADKNILKTEASASPYILAGATRRWQIDLAGHPLPSGGTVRLMAKGDTSGIIDQTIPVTAAL